jgi:hypothetical protein
MNQENQQETTGNETLLIWRERPAGFFSNYFFVLEGMQEALDRKLQAVIGFPPRHNSTWKVQFTGLESWSDYFHVQELTTTKPPSDRNQVFSKSSNRLSNISVADLQRLAGGQMKLRGDIKHEFDSIFTSNISTNNEEVLGVHFRGGDMYWHPDHPAPLLQHQMVFLVEQALSEGPFTQVFVATDTPSFVRRLRRRVHAPVVSTFDFALPQSFGRRLSVKRVLLDAYLLSKCAALIHTQSNVSFAASILRGAPYKVRWEATLGRNPASLFGALLSLIKRVVTPKLLSKELPHVNVVRSGK